MTIKTIKTSLLNIAYEVAGPEDGHPVVLIHGFPDDARAWDAVISGITPHGYRVYAPYLRGYGPTTFLHDETPRSGQNAAIASDILEFAEALSLDKFILVGHDWGAHASQAVAALHPDRVSHLISFAPYSVTWEGGEEGPPNYEQIRALWYMNIMQGDMGEGLLYGDQVSHR